MIENTIGGLSDLTKREKTYLLEQATWTLIDRFNLREEEAVAALEEAQSRGQLHMVTGLRRAAILMNHSDVLVAYERDALRTLAYAGLD